MDVIPVILAGGAGTRLWPLSRDERPKQFHNLSGAGTLFKETVRRLMPLEPARLVVVTSCAHESLTRDELESCSFAWTVLAEPRPRNTAAAVMYAAVYLHKLAGDSIMVCLPADHHIRDNASFVQCIRHAVREAERGALATIGIRPAYPETGYGYIKAAPGEGPVRTVERFVEKPDLAKAREYCASGMYYWNSGIFVWKTSTILGWFRRLMPSLTEAFDAFSGMTAEEIASNKDRPWEIKCRVFDAVESISIDYGIMEKADGCIVVPADFGWTDLGSWKSTDDILMPDADGNRSPEPSRVVFLNSANCSAFPERSRISIVGLRNVIVVEAGGEILVMDKESSQDIRRLVEIVKQR